MGNEKIALFLVITIGLLMALIEKLIKVLEKK